MIKNFTIYWFNGNTINIDSDSKHLKILPNLITYQNKDDLNRNASYQNITNNNVVTKGKSVGEIKQSIAKRRDWEIIEDNTEFIL